MKRIIAKLIVLMCWVTYAQANENPNILWITSEDNNVSWVGCYGNPEAETPNIDQLATEGFQYMHAYANAPVCAPSRSTWITGMHALSTGTLPMRSRYEIPHDQIPYYPDQLKKGGYFTSNPDKTDYNIGGRKDKDCWDNARKIGFADLKKKQPFFHVINIFDSHESKAQGDVSHTLFSPDDVKLRAYHPDVPDVRGTYAKYHDAVKRMDANLGRALRQLEENGLAENTIVIYNSDHGGVLPRSKRYLFSSGIHCPLVIRIPEDYKALWPATKPGSKIDRMVSFVDMPKTWLSLTDSPIPETMQGTIFLGKDAEPEQPYHFSYRSRMDERIENARAVYDKQYVYIRNYMPQVPWVQYLEYLWKMKATSAWEREVKAGRATEVQSRFFAPKGFTEELYDLQRDPDNINNLIHNPEQAARVQKMHKALGKWQRSIYDTALIPESEMVKRSSENGLTIYELARDPDLYPLDELIDAADLALEKDAANLPQLHRLLQAEDCGIRYWGMVGCFLLEEDSVVDAGLADDSHEVRALAAWLAIKTSRKEQGLQCLEELLKQESYATLTVLNMVEWLGEDGRALMPAVRALEPKKKSYEERMKKNLLEMEKDA